MKYFFYFLSIILIVSGFIYLVLSFNLFALGYNFSFYVHFIIRKIQFYFIIIGFVILLLDLKIGG